MLLPAPPLAAMFKFTSVTPDPADLTVSLISSIYIEILIYSGPIVWYPMAAQLMVFKQRLGIQAAYIFFYYLVAHNYDFKEHSIIILLNPHQ